jgi:ribonuclease VapC
VIVDTSALVAILRRDDDAPGFLEAILSTPSRRISAATWLELATVVDSARDPVASTLLDELVNALDLTIEPVTEAQARIARTAWQQYGRGAGTGASLNYGDCFAYALAKELGEPLLFKGGDFSRTDIPFVGPRAERRRLRELLAPYPA